ncbi:hypothetical protein Tco_0018358 [Tanacetum coccineum]
MSPSLESLYNLCLTLQSVSREALPSSASASESESHVPWCCSDKIPCTVVLSMCLDALGSCADTGHWVEAHDVLPDSILIDYSSSLVGSIDFLPTMSTVSESLPIPHNKVRPAASPNVDSL